VPHLHDGIEVVGEAPEVAPLLSGERHRGQA
jgi:hypothetical protein